MTSTPAIERHPRLYFPDGDVVLAAQIFSSGADTPDNPTDKLETCLFRVHKFLLSHHSPTFTNLFGDASATDEELYDGIPVVQMHGDDAEGIALLLTYLYYPTELSSLRPLHCHKPTVVAGVTRLADKYLLETLRKHLIDLVVSDWPKTLQEWDYREKELLACFDNGISNGQPRVCDMFPEPVTAINFAREFGCTEILPAAFYQLSTMRVERHAWEDDVHGNTLSRARWSLLDKDDLLRYIRGCQTLWSFRADTEYFLCPQCKPEMWRHPFDPEGDDLHQRLPCYAYVDKLFQRVWSGSGPDGVPKNILRLYAEMQDDTDVPLPQHGFPRTLCTSCWCTFGDKIAELRQEIWAKLPETFDL